MKKQDAKKWFSCSMGMVLAVAMVLGMFGGLAGSALAADTAVPAVSYAYSAEVETGTIRYMSQITGSGNFQSDYWGSWLYGGPNTAGPSMECCTCTISMALSYVGVNKTPEDILGANNGVTVFTGWGADHLSVGIAEGLDRMASGNGKYSPVLVHFRGGTPGYDSSYGHWVLAVAQSGNCYTILDPARDEMWTLSTNDSLYGYVSETYQYYNADAEIRHPATLPAGVTASKLTLKVTAKKGAVTRVGYTKKDQSAGKVSKGTKLNAVGYIKNASGNVWYYLDDGRYIYSGNVKITGYVSEATISGVSAPSGTLTRGNVFVLKGIVSGKRVTAVTANIKDASGNIVLTARDSVIGSYSLQGSPIDCAMTFNTLSSGSYTYEIVVTETGDSGTACVPYDTVLCSSSFTIS